MGNVWKASLHSVYNEYRERREVKCDKEMKCELQRLFLILPESTEMMMSSWIFFRRLACGFERLRAETRLPGPPQFLEFPS
jgi:hypothetical protein